MGEVNMSRKPADRKPLLDFIAAHPLGVTAAQIKTFCGWKDGAHTFDVLKDLRDKGLVAQHGRTGLSRWCSHEALPAVKAWHAECRAATNERDRWRKRKDKNYVPKQMDEDWVPFQITVPASQCQAPRGVRSVFELGAA
jgi:hypothetical protein